MAAKNTSPFQCLARLTFARLFGTRARKEKKTLGAREERREREAGRAKGKKRPSKRSFPFKIHGIEPDVRFLLLFRAQSRLDLEYLSANGLNTSLSFL